MSLTKSEQETHIWAAGDDVEWAICTEDKKMITLLHNRGWVEYKEENGTYWFSMPRKAISVRSKSSVLSPKKRGKGGLNK